MPSPYQLSVDGLASDLLRVHSLTGKEALSEAYDFEVVVTCEAGFDVERAALGQRAMLAFHVGPEPRAFYGVVAAARLVAVHEVDRKVQYAIRVVPRLWLLRRKQRTRVFQRMRVTDIVASVLGEAGIAARFQLTRAYPEREYCTQYEESDYRFLQRILAETGIFFYFFGGGPLSDAARTGDVLIPGDTLVCADDASCYPPVGGDNAAALAISTAAALSPASGDAPGRGRPAGASAPSEERDVPALAFLENEEVRVARFDKITRFSLRNAVQTTMATFRDYDPMRPMVRLQSTAVSTAPFSPSPLESAAMAAAAAENASSAVALGGAPSGAAASTGGAARSAGDKAAAGAEKLGGALGQRGPLEVYSHHAPFLFPKWGFAADEAPRVLRQKRRRASIARGESGCSDFAPGHRFSLRGHPAPQLDGTYALTSVEHHGQADPDPAHGRGDMRVYWCAFECVPAEIAYPPRREKRKSVQVTLTAIVVGPAGSDIHVDAMGQIKVQFHWDREGKHDDRSSCWIRVMQPWAGAGWGHQFIPRVGQEVVVGFEGGDPDKPIVLGTLYNGTHPPPFSLPSEQTRSGIRTQTSPGGSGFNELSFDDAAGREQVYLHAQANFNEVVGRNHTSLVRNDEFCRVMGSRTDMVERDLTEHVKGGRSHTVEGHSVEVVTGNSDERVSGMRVTRIEGRERRQTRQAADLEYADDLTTRVQGSMTTLVGKSDRKRSWVTHAEGTAELSGLDRLELRSDKELVLRVGKSAIRITEEGIEVLSGGIRAAGKGGSVSVGEDGIGIESKDKAQISVTKRVLFKTEGASLSMEKEVKIDGSKILLNSPDEATDTPPKDPEPMTTIVLTDKETGSPLAQQRYRIQLAGKVEISGLTDKDGKAEVTLPADGKIVFPDLKMPGDVALGPPQPYVVRQGDYLRKLAFTYGFDEEKVWSDPKNEDLAKKRKDPNELLAGDILHFARAVRDPMRIAKGTTNKYKLEVPKTTARFTFEDQEGPFADEPYVLEGLGAEVEGKADGTGTVVIEAPVHVREVRVVFPKREMVFPVLIGDMDPIDEPSGVRQRLEHLGYLPPRAAAISEEDSAATLGDALRRFQSKKKLPPTGTLDDATRAALEEEHGK